MATTEGLLSLISRLKQGARRLGHEDGKRMLASDMRLAAHHLRHYASILIADEAKVEGDPARKRQLQDEACELWCGHE